ncbi:MAG: GNAT family N-acetyltransferase [Rubrivivax sp.]
MEASATVQIRPATAADADAIARVHNASWQRAYAHLLPAEFLAGLSFDRRRDTWARCIAKGQPQVLVVEVGAQVVGLSAVGPSRDDDATPCTFEVWAIYLAPSHWSTGLGRALWLASRQLAQAQGASAITLWVLADNPRAISFYRAAGFEAEPASLRHFTLGGVQLAELRHRLGLGGEPAAPARRPMRTLQHPRCVLEPQVEAHAPAMFEVLSDPAIYEFERVPPPSVERLAAGYRRLESRCSPDGRELWLNWVVRLPTGQLAGYVQATVLASGASCVAYEFASSHWRQGIGSAAVRTMLDELASFYAVRRFVAVLKTANFRSMGLLRRLGFEPGTEADAKAFEAEPDESTLVKCAGGVPGTSDRGIHCR